MGENAEFYVDYGLDPSDPNHMNQFFEMHAPMYDYEYYQGYPPVVHDAPEAAGGGMGGQNDCNYGNDLSSAQTPSQPRSRGKRNNGSNKKRRGGRGGTNRRKVGAAVSSEADDSAEAAAAGNQSAPRKLNPSATEWRVPGAAPLPLPLNPSAAEWRPPFGAATNGDDAATDGPPRADSSNNPAPATVLSPGSAATAPPSPSRVTRIWVGNLPFHDAEAKDVIALCEQYGYGPVSGCVMPRNEDGRFKGYAFVTLPADKAEEAKKNLNGVEFRGRTIRANDVRAKWGGRAH